MAKKRMTKVQEFEKAVLELTKQKYLLRLYVSGMTPKSIRAIANLKKICEEHLKGRCELRVIDIYQQPGRIREDEILVSPTLVKKLPLPVRRIIGDLSNTEKVLVGLDLEKRPPKKD